MPNGDGEVYQLNVSSDTETVEAKRKTGWIMLSDLSRTNYVRRMNARFDTQDEITVNMYADGDDANSIYQGTLRRTSGYVYESGQSNVVVTSSALDATTTTVGVDDATNLSAGDHIKVDSEVMFVRAISNNTLTVDRGRLNTTAASHSNAQLVSYAGPQHASLRVGRRAKHLMVEVKTPTNKLLDTEIGKLEIEVDV